MDNQDANSQYLGSAEHGEESQRRQPHLFQQRFVDSAIAHRERPSTEDRLFGESSGNSPLALEDRFLDWIESRIFKGCHAGRESSLPARPVFLGTVPK